MKVLSATGRALALAAWLAAGATPALGDGPAPTVEPPLNDPQWLYVPAYEEVMRLYPERALRLEKEGSATVRCVHRQGRLSDCVSIAEDPEDYSFGRAAMKIAALYRLRPTTAEGGEVRLTVPFTIDPAWLAKYCPKLEPGDTRKPPPGGYAPCVWQSAVTGR